MLDEKLPPAVAKESANETRERALEGLPHYWKLPWGWDDVIILPCGHAKRVAVAYLSDPEFVPNCPYKAIGACTDANQVYS